MASEVTVVRYQTEQGHKAALKRVSGPKRIQVLILSGPLTVRSVPLEEERYMTAFKKDGKPYPIKKAIRHFRHFGRTSGITKNAKTFLKEASL